MAYQPYKRVMQGDNGFGYGAERAREIRDKTLYCNFLRKEPARLDKKI